MLAVQQKLKKGTLMNEPESLRTAECVRAEHKRERKADLRAGHEREKTHLLSVIAALKARIPTYPGCRRSLGPRLKIEQVIVATLNQMKLLPMKQRSLLLLHLME